MVERQENKEGWKIGSENKKEKLVKFLLNYPRDQIHSKKVEDRCNKFVKEVFILEGPIKFQLEKAPKQTALIFTRTYVGSFGHYEIFIDAGEQEICSKVRNVSNPIVAKLSLWASPST